MILKPTACDVKQLPLGAIEAFVLSQLDGLLDLEALAEVTGIDAATIEKVAARLVELGAAVDASKAAKRRDPRAEETMYPPKSTRPKTVRPGKHPTPKSMTPPKSPKSIRAPKSVRPSRSSHPPKSSPPPKSVRANKVPVIDIPPVPEAPPISRARPHVPSAAAPDSAPVSSRKTDDGTSDLDEATLENLSAIEAKILTTDRYGLFDLERDADKKAIKRAYFAIATQYHPDRFFGKKLGPHRARIEAIFRHFTDAHDLLTDSARRKTYDATLPPPTARPAKKASRLMKAVTRKLDAVKVEEAPAPASGQMSAPTSGGAPLAAGPRKTPTSRPPARPSVKLKVSQPAISVSPNAPFSGSGPASFPLSAPFNSQKPVVHDAPPSSGSASPTSAIPVSAGPSSGGVSSGPVASARSGDVRAGLMAAKVQARIDMLVKAGEDALAANDILGAANNYRLALEHREDRRLRFIFEDLDARGRTLRFDKHMVAAKAAERDARWADAAIFLQRANDAKPDCDVASRAATALRLGGGDLDRAEKLGEQAVETAPRNPHYRLALAAVYLVNKSPDRAKEEAETARKLAPKDEDVQAMASEILKKA